jgi:hypothetical protein
MLALGRSASAQLNIVLNAGAGLSGNAAALAAFNRAASKWENLFTDAVTVNINADFTNMGNPNIIGTTYPEYLVASYDTIRNRMALDASDEPDNAVVAFLPTAAQFSAQVPAGLSLSGLILISQANANALGFNVHVSSDADMTFNTQFSFDFDNSDGVGAGLTDFESIAIHELGHALGFASAVDDFDYWLKMGIRTPIAITPLDLFRFGSGSIPTTTAEFTSNARNFVPGANAFTSDITNAYRMSTGTFFGDGYQASHWKADEYTGTNIGIMDPSFGPGFVGSISQADIRAMDLIGWDVRVQEVPEPGTLASLLGLGISAGAFSIRRRWAC